jgi:hypothetical protein
MTWRTRLPLRTHKVPKVPKGVNNCKGQVCGQACNLCPVSLVPMATCDCVCGFSTMNVSLIQNSSADGIGNVLGPSTAHSIQMRVPQKTKYLQVSAPNPAEILKCHAEQTPTWTRPLSYGMPPTFWPPSSTCAHYQGETRSRSLSTLKDSHYESMHTAGVFVDAGDFEYDPAKLPNVWNERFEGKFLRTSCRSVCSP